MPCLAAVRVVVERGMVDDWVEVRRIRKRKRKRRRLRRGNENRMVDV